MKDTYQERFFPFHFFFFLFMKKKKNDKQGFTEKKSKTFSHLEQNL